MGEINDHSAGFHLAHPLAAQRGQAALCHSCGGAANGGVSKVSGGHHADTDGVEVIKVFEIAFQGLCAFGSQEAGDLAGRTRGQVFQQVRTRIDDRQLTVRVFSKAA